MSEIKFSPRLMKHYRMRVLAKTGMIFLPRIKSLDRLNIEELYQNAIDGFSHEEIHIALYNVEGQKSNCQLDNLRPFTYFKDTSGLFLKMSIIIKTI